MHADSVSTLIFASPVFGRAQQDYARVPIQNLQPMSVNNSGEYAWARRFDLPDFTFASVRGGIPPSMAKA
jgi:hypothetical protein